MRIVRQTTTHSDLLVMLIERSAPIEAIERYMDLADRNARTIARQEYNEALANFRGKRIRVMRSREVNAGPLKGTAYAVLSDFVNATAPELAEFGLSAAWRITKEEKDWIEVGCIVRHRGGHEETTTMGGPPDVGGAKNAIQARASTVSYLEKYTLKMALGLAEENDDDDGNGGRQQGEPELQRRESADAPPPEKPAYSAESFAANLPKWAELIHTGKKTAAQVIANVETRATLTKAQKDELTKLEPPK